MFISQNDKSTLLPVNRRLEIYDLGLLPFETAYLKQRELVERKKQNFWESDFLLFVEHPEIYTFGRKSKSIPTHLPNIASIERGGEATYHNPGQVVCYPIVFLDETERDIPAFLRKLESVIIQSLMSFGIESYRKEGATGIWIDGDKKIASIGIAFSGWVSFHGLALNVNNDLKGFSQINPCGFDATVMTSMQNVLQDKCPSLEVVKRSLTTSFKNVFFYNR